MIFSLMIFSFKKGKGTLKQKEIDRAIAKLKNLYKEYASVYGNRIFNLKAFEDRYLDALKNKRDIRAFLHAEVSIFEELKTRVLKIQEDSSKPDSGLKIQKNTQSEENLSYSEIADRIIEENLSKIKKYRLIDFHPDAEIETKYLLGAVTDFYYNKWSNATKIIKELNNHNFNSQIEKLESDFSYYILPVRNEYSRAVEDYQFVLAKKNPKDNEKAAVNFIKYGAILLNNCERLINSAYNAITTTPLFENRAEELKSHLDNLRSLIKDFRLQDIRSY